MLLGPAVVVLVPCLHLVCPKGGKEKAGMSSIFNLPENVIQELERIFKSFK